MIIRVRVIPNAKHNEVMGRLGSVVRVRIKGRAVEGQANAELNRIFSGIFLEFEKRA